MEVLGEFGLGMSEIYNRGVESPSDQNTVGI